LNGGYLCGDTLAGPKAYRLARKRKTPVVRISTKLMVCELLMGVVAHARFQRHNAAHLAIRHGGVTLQTL